MRISKLHFPADYTDFALKYANFETTNPCRWSFLLWDIQTFQVFQTSTLRYANIKVTYSCRWPFLLWDTQTFKLQIPADGCFLLWYIRISKLPFSASEVTNPCLESYQSLPQKLPIPACQPLKTPVFIGLWEGSIYYIYPSYTLLSIKDGLIGFAFGVFLPGGFGFTQKDEWCIMLMGESSRGS